MILAEVGFQTRNATFKEGRLIHKNEPPGAEMAD